MHGLNAETYLERVLRPTPHWPVTRVLELSPKYWTQTLAGLDERHRRVITPPWELAPRERRAQAGRGPGVRSRSNAARIAWSASSMRCVSTASEMAA